MLTKIRCQIRISGINEESIQNNTFNKAHILSYIMFIIKAE